MSDYLSRHIGFDDDTEREMLARFGFATIDAFMHAALPADLASSSTLTLPPALSEQELSVALRTLADQNEVRTPMIGLGYYRSITPAVIRRNVLENPAWYTAYTPYQPEISQGRLEALLVFQHMVEDLTGLPIANASLLDEATAAAEAMALAHRSAASDSNIFAVDADTHPATVAVLRTRARPLGIEIVVVENLESVPECFGLLVSFPGSSGGVRDLEPIVESVHAKGGLVTVATDLLALCLLRSPAEFGADIAVGSAQRFGIPLAFGGPHAGFMAVRSGLERSLPGRIVGVSVDAEGRNAYRLALQTREQHIRRERATSNICTSQVLLAVMSGFYAAYHGPKGLIAIAQHVAGKAEILAAALKRLGGAVAHDGFFGTVQCDFPGHAEQISKAAAAVGIDIRCVSADTVALSVDEVTRSEELQLVVDAVAAGVAADPVAVDLDAEPGWSLPTDLRRTSEFLTHPWFNQYHSETDMMRWLRALADRDLALDRSMIPLGSCTMKLNPAVAMEPITWPEFADIHPYAPTGTFEGYRELIDQLCCQLAEITGYAKVSVQPNAGSQGEFSGLTAIHEYHRSRGDLSRDVCLIPSSAHGTNAASAAMAGLRVVVVACDDSGGVDLADLRRKIEQHSAELAAVMITYPSTYGIYEETVREVCDLVHAAGGQVYIDGANLNALVGWARFGDLGADVSHLNLHKTFCIPHGGGGPGVGPVAVQEHLIPFLPDESTNAAELATSTNRISGAPFGSAGILPIPFAYISMMGGPGLRRATASAVLAANYIANRLGEYYPVLYRGANDLVAHECILDIRPLTKESGVTVDDIAKRLADFGFHAPTMSFPVAGTLMVEPTESESKTELDRFCEAMIDIRSEINDIVAGLISVEDSPLRHAPHTAEQLVGDWDRHYSREQAVYPNSSSRERKYWPPVARIDGAYGDRNLICSCPPVETFQ